MSGYQHLRLKIFNMAPVENLKTILEQLCELRECTKSQNHRIENHLKDSSLDLIAEAAFNVLNAKPKRISKKSIENLKAHKKTLVYLSNPKNSIENKRKRIIKQKGDGLISLLVSTAIPLLASLIAKKS